MITKKTGVAYLILFGIIVCHIILLVHTVFWPGTEFRIFPYLTTRGFLPYKEIAEQHFPGVFSFPLNIYSVGLATPEGLRWIQIVLVICNQIFIFHITKLLTQKNTTGLMATILYLFMQIFFEGYSLWVDSFIVPLTLLSCLLLININKGYWPVFFSGWGMGLALVCKQQIGIVSGIIFLYLFFIKRQKQSVIFAIGVLLPVIGMLIYLYRIGVFSEFYFWTITFNQTIYKQYAFRSLTLTEVLYLAAVCIPTFCAAVYIFFKQKNQQNALLFLYFTPLLILVYGRYDFIHLQPALGFAVILITIAGMSLPSHYKKIIPVTYIIFFAIMSFGKLEKLGTSTTFIEKQRPDLVAGIKKYTSQKKTIFIDNAEFELYQLTNSIPSNHYLLLYLPWYMDVGRDRLSSTFLANPPDIIVAVVPHSQAVPTIATYIRTHYKTAQTFGDREILVRQ